MRKTIRHAVAAVAVAACFAGAASARPGPDVTYAEITDVANHGVIGGIRAYTLGTATCNMGNQNLLWSNGGTPAVGFNMYRIYDGRIEQIGMSFCKTACCAAATSGCGLACNGQGGSVLGAGCRDVYGSGWNSLQNRLAPRSAINPYTGAISTYSTATGNEIFKRLQVQQSDLMAANFPNALYFVEGVYVATDDAQAGNALNNASHRRVTVNQSSFALSFANLTVATVPAIQAWRDHGLGPNTPDPSVNIFTVDVPNEGRFWVGTKVTDLGDNRWRYDYAIYNHNSHAAGGSFTIPLGAGVNPASIGFHDVDYHSGEVYSNADWNSAITPQGLQWSSPEPFSVNPNSNALRWGTMYNFWFEANTAPVMGSATLGLFRPHTPQAVSIDVPVPGSACLADWNQSGNVDSNDFFDFVEDFFNLNADFNGDGLNDSQDFFDFLVAFYTPC